MQKHLPQEHKARDKSEILAWIGFCLAIYLVGILIGEAFENVFSVASSAALIYMTIGAMVMKNKKVMPGSTQKIRKGEIDLLWGFQHLYWTCWWPRYL